MAASALPAIRIDRNKLSTDIFSDFKVKVAGVGADHLLAGLHLKALAKSALFCTVPSTRYSPRVVRKPTDNSCFQSMLCLCQKTRDFMKTGKFMTNAGGRKLPWVSVALGSPKCARRMGRTVRGS